MKLKDRAVVEGIIVPAMIAAINGAVWGIWYSKLETYTLSVRDVGTLLALALFTSMSIIVAEAGVRRGIEMHRRARKG